MSKVGMYLVGACGTETCEHHGKQVAIRRASLGATIGYWPPAICLGCGAEPVWEEEVEEDGITEARRADSST